MSRACSPTASAGQANSHSHSHSHSHSRSREIGSRLHRYRARTPRVERRRAVRIAVRPEAARIELVLEVARLALRRRLDAHDVLAGARGAAVTEQVVALRERLDPRSHLLEGGADLPAVLVQHGTVATDRAKLAAVDLGADTDHHHVDVRLLDMLV